MKRPISASNIVFSTDSRAIGVQIESGGRPTRPSPRAFTLIEILVATALSLLLLGSVIAMFGTLTGKVAESRSMLEMAEQLRLTSVRLQQDLAGLTVTPNPPRRQADNEGYLEIYSMVMSGGTVAMNTDNSNKADATVGNVGCMLMFTTRSKGRPFVGKFGTSGTATIQSEVAEVAWFLRGKTLHRRVLLVAPGVTASGSTADYYTNYDVSARYENSKMVPNTLGDLTQRENRYAHSAGSGALPYYWTYSSNRYPTLPTLAECSNGGWLPSTTTVSVSTFDPWRNNPTGTSTYYAADDALTSPSSGTRTADDIIMTNVIGFDVKVFDPKFNNGQGGYVNLGYGSTIYSASNANTFAHYGQNSTLQGSASRYCVYDTWSTTYFGSAWSDGMDVGGTSGIVDDDGEAVNLPPYPIPLRGIQVEIRAFDPDSKQIRKVTIEQNFLP